MVWLVKFGKVAWEFWKFMCCVKSLSCPPNIEGFSWGITLGPGVALCVSGVIAIMFSVGNHWLHHVSVGVPFWLMWSVVTQFGCIFHNYFLQLFPPWEEVLGPNGFIFGWPTFWGVWETRVWEFLWAV